MPDPVFTFIPPYESYRGGLLTPADIFVVSEITSVARNANGKITSLVLRAGGLLQTVTISRDGSDNIASITATQPT